MGFADGTASSMRRPTIAPSKANPVTFYTSCDVTGASDDLSHLFIVTAPASFRSR